MIRPMKTLPKTITTFLPLLVALLLVCTVRAESAPAEQVEGAEQQFHWLIYFNGARVGWHSTTVAHVTHDDEPAIREIYSSQITISRSFDEQTFVNRTSGESLLRACGTPITRTRTVTAGDQKREYTAVYGESVSLTEVIDGGRPKTSTHEVNDVPALTSTGAWMRLTADGAPKPDTRFEYLAVAFGDHALALQSWTVIGEAEHELRAGGSVSGTEIRIVDQGRLQRLIMGSDGQPKLLELTGGFAMERTATLPEEFQPEPVRMANIMEAEVNVRNFRNLESMKMRFAFRHDDDVEGIPPIADTNRYHEVIREDDGYLFKLLRQPLSEEARKVAFPLEEVPDELEPYLRATPMYQADDPILMEVAKGLVKDTDNASEAARAIMNFVRGHLRSGSGDTGSASARQAYDEEQGDCTEHAALFVALARAAGLPARGINGLTYISANRNRAIWGFHAWAEVWLGEWVPVDTTVQELGLSARFIKLSIEEPGHTHGAGRSSRMMDQAIKPRIDAYTLTNGYSWSRND
jgi:hypothetical protein